MESLTETSNDSYVCSHLQNSSQAANLHLNEKVAKVYPNDSILRMTDYILINQDT